MYTVILTGWYRTASQALRPLLIYCVFPIRVLIVTDSSTRSLYQKQRHLAVKQGESWCEMAVNFADEVSVILRRDFNIVVKSYNMEPTALLPPEGSAAEFYHP
jgi:hypothetical protein